MGEMKVKKAAASGLNARIPNTYTHTHDSSSTLVQKKSPVGMLQTTAARIEDVAEQQQQQRKKAASSRWAEPSEEEKDTFGEALGARLGIRGGLQSQIR